MKGFNILPKTFAGIWNVKIFSVFTLICAAFCAVSAQSTSQNFPTPITVNEISGKIPARDIGDARLTNYFYTFNTTQGDVFINVVTSNLNGDIDVFTADNLRPLTKITLYADAGETETGRVIYLRQPTKLILRIEGRTPNDNAANFRVKFAGSFVPAEISAANSDAETPQVKSDNQTDVRVNSVGTIIKVEPKPAKPKVVISEIKPVEEVEERETEKKEANRNKADARKTRNQTENLEESANIKKDNKTDDAADAESSTKNNRSNDNAKTDSSKTEETNEETSSSEITKPKTSVKAVTKSKTVKPVPASALEGIRLIILLKDGTRFERSMSDILKFGVDRGILTVIARDGEIKRYSILDVEKTTIE